MTKLQIFLQATKITVNRKSLWLFGIFLASAFNLHTWYAAQWLSETNLFILVSDQFFATTSVQIILLGVVIITFAFVVVNFCKLMFLGLVHNGLHDVTKDMCPLCIELKQTSIFKYLWQAKYIVWHTVGASFLTALTTAMVLGSFHIYSLHSEYSLLKTMLMILSVLVALVLISWWNLFTVLFIFWYQQSLTKAAIMAADTIALKFRSIASITILATAVFLVSVAAAGTVLWQLPALLSTPPEYFLPVTALAAWRVVVAIVASTLFLFWLLLNNIWFNVVMILWFDQLIKAKKVPQSTPGVKLAQPNLSVHLHHSIDKSQEIL